jgi:hypothetical protein
MVVDTMDLWFGAPAIRPLQNLCHAKSANLAFLAQLQGASILHPAKFARFGQTLPLRFMLRWRPEAFAMIVPKFRLSAFVVGSGPQ